MYDYSEVVAKLKALVPPDIAADPIMSQVMDEFLVEIPEKVVEIGRLLESGELNEAMRFAHQLKGSGGTFGLTVIAGAAGKLEKALKTGIVMPEITALYRELRGVVGLS